MARLRIALPASADLQEIWDYIASDNPDAADSLLASLFKGIDRLIDFPGLGPRRDELRPGLRSLTVGNYLIFYVHRAADDVVEVVRVVHGSRDLRSLFRTK